jgi:hypothetical protein
MVFQTQDIIGRQCLVEVPATMVEAGHVLMAAKMQVIVYG